jgi:glucose/mannose-6-phosphate isomerase
MNEQHEALRKFSYQINYAVNNYKPHGLKATDFNNIIIAGLGGSGIGGQIVKAFFSNDMPIPVNCVADYSLPAYASEKTLVIAASYSGNTEETISVFSDAQQRGCKILALTTGGKLEQLTQSTSVYTLKIEGGFQPRMALGFSLTYLVMLMGELIGKNYKEELSKIATTLAETESYYEDADAMFQEVRSRIKSKFVVLADALLEPIAIRFAQQIQENAKHECFVHVLPEMNHNVIESYYDTLDSVFFVMNSGQNERVNLRFDFITGLLEVENHKVLTMHLEQFNLLSVYELIHRLDWVSLMVADERRVDSLNVPNIMSLKEYLA